MRDPDGSGSVLAVLDDDPDIRCNDGSVGPDGALYVGTMRRDNTGRVGRLYRVDPTGAVDVVLAGLGISNGLAWSPDGSRTYFVDSLDGRVDVLELVSGRREPFAAVAGTPDGSTVSADGSVWVAVWGGSRVDRFDEEGALRDSVVVPAPHTTACTLGGPGLRDLYITTARQGLSQAELAAWPRSGSVFVVPDAAQGLPTTAFHG